MLQIVMGIVVLALFAASFVWGADSRVGFTDPRQREGWLLNRRGEVR